MAPGRRRSERERGFRRAVWIGLAASLLVHIVLVFFVSRGLYLESPDYESPSTRPISPEGIDIVRVRTTTSETPSLPSPAPPLEPAAEETVEPDPEAEPTPIEGGEEEAAETGEEELTNAERLRPREGDPRLWREIDLTAFERLARTSPADSAVRAILRRYLDSLQLSEEERRRARDWTFGEGDERWGISEEGLHLGDITIPIPFGQLLQPSGPLRRELEQELRDLEAIQRQEALDQAEDVREERVEEMLRRAREQAEEEEAEEDTSSTGGGDAPTGAR
ncbi:MAG: hypothetical protein ACOC83_06820 [Gemmatimonadota bacterium]